MTDAETFIADDQVPSTALVERILARSAEVVIIEASPDEIGRGDAARVVVSGRRARPSSTAPRSCSPPSSGPVRTTARSPNHCGPC